MAENAKFRLNAIGFFAGAAFGFWFEGIGGALVCACLGVFVTVAVAGWVSPKS